MMKYSLICFVPILAFSAPAQDSLVRFSNQCITELQLCHQIASQQDSIAQARRNQLQASCDASENRSGNYQESWQQLLEEHRTCSKNLSQCQDEGIDQCPACPSQCPACPLLSNCSEQDHPKPSEQKSRWPALLLGIIVGAGLTLLVTSF